MAKLDGGCLCGAARYSSTAEPLRTVVCHCKNCQKQSGTAFSIIVVVPQDGFKVAGDALAVYEDVGDSGQAVQRHFCRSCGSPLYSQIQMAPDRIFIKAGTLDDTTWLKPQANVWCRSAQSWVALDSSIPRFEQSAMRK